MDGENVNLEDLDEIIYSSTNMNIKLSDEEIDELLIDLGSEFEINEDEKNRFEKLEYLREQLNILSSSLKYANEEELEFLKDNIDNLVNVMLKNDKVREEKEYNVFLKKDLSLRLK